MNVADTRYWSGSAQGGGERSIGTSRTAFAPAGLNF
jgi:hypothetical protein